ncbi:hypothetical protein HMPREF9318_01771 [Streptococcus urinalis FB127-CNA-2]|uniref:Transcriptional regulator, MarR family n=1 Tax=Streptococcus urinalis 2285-97 TaxID=764291 RepID=G5KE77_9STRE|nr:MarR family transcriptional regulator [Streptococcus urinalis]EHJ56074.1 transcriptional regulator, MarR family [Streptococcus urinalis 2285-97]EKS18272.1 hypothetical protein HMPREF9318_01771 [Streptococcus urinalis FB127-CNA-2]VEF32854.1 Transcriptional regulator, MarR family [Streptococcus urinalis]
MANAMESGFRELKNFINEVEQFIYEEAKHFDVEHLGGPQGFVIMYLLENPDKDLSFKDVESHLKISKSVTSNLIRRMERNGFVEVQISKKDKRVKHICLTDFGRGKADQLKQYLDHIHDVFLKDITKEDAEITRKVLFTLKTNIKNEMKRRN